MRQVKEEKRQRGGRRVDRREERVEWKSLLFLVM